MLNAHISADVIEVSEFPEMAQRYQIYGVPKTVINDAVEFEGAIPEAQFIQAVLSATQAASGEGEGPEV
jgi:predicted DsbA family dithiol-disulfide isomerase